METKKKAFVAAADFTRLDTAAGTLFIAGPLIFLFAEFIAAAAWTHPPYSYTYHFISNLGVHGPSTLFGQYMYSPLAWVMNTGFFLFGIIILAGVILLRGLQGWRRWAVLLPAILLGLGGVLLALYPGSGEAMANGTGYHAEGAMAGFIGGNALAILLGSLHGHIGLSPKLGRGLVTAGVIGLLSMVLYFVEILSDANILVGLVERGATHPFLISLIFAGVSIRKRQTSPDL